MAVSGLACVAIGHIVTDDAVATSAAVICGVKMLLVANGAMITMSVFRYLQG